MSENRSKLKVLDLFSGILVGGFSLGLERSRTPCGQPGFETVAFCEIEEFPRKVLRKHWPEVPQYHDVTKLTGSILASDGIAVDVITGGFPCQDLSCAGKQAGITNETRSGLWSECIRLVGELRPAYAIFENVSDLLSGPSIQPGGWFSRVLIDLARCGYDAEWRNIPAWLMGAPHKRERVWIVAYPRKERRPRVLPIIPQECGFAGDWQDQATIALAASRRLDAIVRGQLDGEPAFLRSDDDVPNVVDRLGACGNAVIPQIPEMIGNAILATEVRQ